jgi:hypothetical protein
VIGAMAQDLFPQLPVLQNIEGEQSDDEQEEEKRIQMPQLREASLDGLLRVAQREKDVFHNIILAAEAYCSSGDDRKL